MAGVRTTKEAMTADAPARSKTGFRMNKPSPERISEEKKRANDLLFLSCQRGDMNAMKQAIGAGADVNAKDKLKWTPIMWSARNGFSDMIMALKGYGADVNAKNNNGWTALMEASREGQVQSAKALLEIGADPNERSESGLTALKLATKKNHAQIIALLHYYKARE